MYSSNYRMHKSTNVSVFEKVYTHILKKTCIKHHTICGKINQVRKGHQYMEREKKGH